MNLFYHPLCSLNSDIAFDEGEAVHIIKVLRKRDGEIIDITNGKGDFFKATLKIEGKRVSAFCEGSGMKPTPKIQLELAVGLTKNQDRLEWFVEKAVEIGVGKITLLKTQHAERGHLRKERLDKVAVSAMKQSLKSVLPEIVGPVEFSEWITSSSVEVKCIAHCRDQNIVILKNVLQKGKSAAIAIGPEGDFSVEEISNAEKNGFISVSLGQSRLRTETAAMCAVHTFEIVNQ